MTPTGNEGWGIILLSLLLLLLLVLKLNREQLNQREIGG